MGFCFLSLNAFCRAVPTNMQMKHCREINMIQAAGKSLSVHSAQEPNPCCRQQVGFLCFSINLGDNTKVWIFHTRNTNNLLHGSIHLLGGKTVFLTVCVLVLLCCWIQACCFGELTANQQLLLLPLQQPLAHPLLPVSSITASPDPVGSVSIATTIVYSP